MEQKDDQSTQPEDDANALEASGSQVAPGSDGVIDATSPGDPAPTSKETAKKLAKIFNKPVFFCLTEIYLQP